MAGTQDGSALSRLEGETDIDFVTRIIDGVSVDTVGTIARAAYRFPGGISVGGIQMLAAYLVKKGIV